MARKKSVQLDGFMGRNYSVDDAQGEKDHMMESGGRALSALAGMSEGRLAEVQIRRRLRLEGGLGGVEGRNGCLGFLSMFRHESQVHI